MTTAIASATAIRPLTREDLTAAAALDAAVQGHSRLSYLQRRLAAALREPQLHAQFCTADEDGLTGIVLGRVLEGEFGATHPTMRLEVVAVHPDAQRRRLGTRLLDALGSWAVKRGIVDIETQAVWTDHAMLAWLEARGFRLAASHVVECEVDLASDTPAPAPDDGAASEVRYDAETLQPPPELARDCAEVCSMAPADLDEIVRIDRHITGHDRRPYMARKLAEAMHDSGICVSLTARVGDNIAGYAMARADYGDFGRPEPVAVLDTIGVDPALTHRGVGHALVAQLCANLRALHIERLETIVAPRDLTLLRFLYDAGFEASQRLPFARRLLR